MHAGEVCRIAVLRKTDSPVRSGRVWSNPDLYPILFKFTAKCVQVPRNKSDVPHHCSEWQVACEVVYTFAQEHI